MTYYEILSLVTAVLAAFIAFVALYRTHRVAERQIELQEIQSAFARFQHELLAREQTAKQRADVRVMLTQSEANRKIIFVNHGHVDAKDVTFSTTALGEQSPFIQSEVDSLFPLNTLRPGEEARMLISVSLDTLLPIPVIVHWKDPNGTSTSNEFKLSL